jgi:hypothetical protein
MPWSMLQSPSTALTILSSSLAPQPVQVPTRASLRKGEFIADGQYAACALQIHLWCTITMQPLKHRMRLEIKLLVQY